MADIRNDLRRAPQAAGREVLRVEVSAPSPLLKDGLAFVDTPGVGGHGQPHLSATLGLLPDADAHADGQRHQPGVHRTGDDGSSGRPSKSARSAAIVATKTDLYPHWRADRRRQHRAPAARRAVDLPMIPASSLLRSHAIQLNDKELNEESNFPAIVKFLTEKVLSRENDRVRDHVVAEIRSAAEHLTSDGRTPSWRR